MQLTVNGKKNAYEPDLTVSRLVQLLELKPKGVAIEVNREIVSKSRWDDHRLGDGDIVEIVTFVGGG